MIATIPATARFCRQFIESSRIGGFLPGSSACVPYPLASYQNVSAQAPTGKVVASPGLLSVAAWPSATQFEQYMYGF
jgi:hypothetical protein